MSKEDIIREFELFKTNNEGIESWVTDKTDDIVLQRLGSIVENPLRKVQLNQLLAFAHEGTVSDGFFKYYWLTAPDHPYNVRGVPFFNINN
jgi:hypothetical protein